MDRATKVYAYFLLAATLGFVIWLFYEDPTVTAINNALSDDPEIAAFPYRFHVKRLEGATAIMATPRSTQVPVARILGGLFPEVARHSPDSETFQKAQRRLASVQKRARRLVLGHPDVTGVRWELDERWLWQHGIQIRTGDFR